jgi:hypothetical protein
VTWRFSGFGLKNRLAQKSQKFFTFLPEDSVLGGELDFVDAFGSGWTG